MTSRSQNAGKCPDGLILLNKKSGVTSFQALGEVKKTFSTRKAGHTGTLDKFATGLLLVLVGRASKLSFLFNNFSKEYRGTILFGEETDTLDPEGEVIATGPIPSREEVEAVLDAFRGNILQSPPAYSALHIDGHRAYELARQGKVPEMKKRPITIHELEIVSWTAPEAVIRVKVSAGTYIRSLARDIALAAGTRARLSALERISVGPFHLEEAFPSVQLTDLRPIDNKLFETLSLPALFLEDKKAEDFIHGKALELIIQNEQGATMPECGAIENGGTEIENAGVFRKNVSKNTENAFLGVITRKKEKWGYGYVYAGN